MTQEMSETSALPIYVYAFDSSEALISSRGMAVLSMLAFRAMGVLPRDGILGARAARPCQAAQLLASLAEIGNHPGHQIDAIQGLRACPRARLVRVLLDRRHRRHDLGGRLFTAEIAPLLRRKNSPYVVPIAGFFLTLGTGTVAGSRESANDFTQFPEVAG